MEPKAWDYTMILVTQLFHQMPIILQKQRQKQQFLSIDHCIFQMKNVTGDIQLVYNLRYSIDCKMSYTRIKGCFNQLWSHVQDSWILEVTMRIKKLHGVAHVSSLIN